MFTEFNKIYSMEIDLKNLEVVHNSKALYSNVDLNTSTMMVKLSMDNKSLNLTDTSIIAYIKAGKNNNVTMERCNILDPTEGIIGLDFKSSSLQAGTNTFFLEIKSNNGEIINSPLITYKVVELFDVSEGAEGDNHTSILVQLISEVEVIKESVETLRDEIIAAEEIRKSNESTRVQNEQQRVNSETGRETAENVRANSESDRVDAENTRVSNETTRVENETQRVIAESDRESAENDRVTAESKRVEDFEKIKTDNNTLSTDLTRKVDSKIAEMEGQNETFKQTVHEQYGSFIEVVEEQILNSKTDYFGKEHLSVEERLNEDFDNVHQRINDSSLLEYEGCNISAENTYYGITKDTVIKGRTLQNLATGLKSVNSCWINENDYFYLNISDGTQPTIHYSIAYALKTNTVYTVIGEMKDYNVGYLHCSFYDGTNYQNGSNQFIVNANGTFKYTLTTNDNVNISSIRLFPRNTTPNIYRLSKNVLVIEGDHTNTPIEELPYGEGIYSVGEKTKNLFDVRSVKLHKGMVAKYVGEVVDIVDNVSRAITFIDVIGVTNITVNYNGNYAICEMTSDNKLIKDYGWNNTPITFNLSSNCNKLGISLRVSGNNEPIPSNFIENLKIQISEGTIAIPYEEYFDKYRVQAKSTGKNLFDIKAFINVKGVNANNDNDIYYSADGDYLISLPRYDHRSWVSMGTQTFKSNTEYIISVDSSEVYIEVWVPSGEKTSGFGNVTFATRNTGEAIFKFNAGKETESKFRVMLEEGVTQTSYEPYQEDIKTYYLDEPLNGLPSGVCDTIEENKIVRRVGKVVLDGSEKWAKGPDSQNLGDTMYFANFDYDSLAKINTDSLSNMFPKGSTWKLDTECHEFIGSGEGRLRLRILKSKLETQDVDGFKQWLSENPTTIWYELAEPYEEYTNTPPLKLKSFDTRTYITSTNTLLPVIKAKIPSNVQAVVSNLRNNNNTLTKEVSDLSLENKELKDTNDLQDVLIDTTMLATDEMFTMIEPLLSQVAETLQLTKEVSKLVDMYVAMVMRGLKTIDEVPSRYREQVKEILRQLEK